MLECETVLNEARRRAGEFPRIEIVMGPREPAMDCFACIREIESLQEAEKNAAGYISGILCPAFDDCRFLFSRVVHLLFMSLLAPSHTGILEGSSSCGTVCSSQIGFCSGEIITGVAPEIMAIFPWSWSRFDFRTFTYYSLRLFLVAQFLKTPLSYRLHC